MTRRRRSALNIDRVLGAVLFVGIVGGMATMVGYANYRDAQHFRQEAVSSFPSRPQDINQG